MVACPALIRGREEWGIFWTSARISLKAFDGITTCLGRSSGFSPASRQACFQISSVKPSTKILAPLAQPGFKFTPFFKSRRPESDWFTALSKLAGVRWNVTTHASSPIVEGMGSLWIVDANCASTNFWASSGEICAGGSSWKTSWVPMPFTSPASFHSLTSVSFGTLAWMRKCSIKAFSWNSHTCFISSRVKSDWSFHAIIVGPELGPVLTTRASCSWEARKNLTSMAHRSLWEARWSKWSK